MSVADTIVYFINFGGTLGLAAGAAALQYQHLDDGSLLKS